MGYADMYETINVKHETINVMGYADDSGNHYRHYMPHYKHSLSHASRQKRKAVSVVEL